MKKYREFVQTLSDEALINEGKQMRWLSGDGKIVTTPPSAFQELKICREEYRRSHPSITAQAGKVQTPQPPQAPRK